MARKAKIIHLCDEEKEKLSIQAIKKGMDLKNYIEWVLNQLANNKVNFLD